MKLLIGSNNPNKINEFKQLILNKKLNIELFTPTLLNIKINPKEIENTLELNSKIKATEFFEASNVPSFSDDSGLFIHSLKNEPGVFSARYAGLNSNDEENRQKVLKNMNGLNNRLAYFKTVICFKDFNNTYFFKGKITGKISKEEKGHNGFGYDSIFIPDGYNNTFAELSREAKNRISHRALAFNQFINFLKDYKN